MALIKPGVWHSTVWASGTWQEDLWLEYGTATVAAGDSAKYYYFKRKKPQNEVFGYLKELLQKIGEQTE